MNAFHIYFSIFVPLLSIEPEPTKPSSKRSRGPAKPSLPIPTPAVQTPAAQPAPPVIQASVSAPVIEAAPRDAVVLVALADFVPDALPRGQVPPRVSRSMTATGAQPLVRPDMDGPSIELQLKQARENRGPQPPPSP